MSDRKKRSGTAAWNALLLISIIANNDKVLSTSTWLKYDEDTAARGGVVALKCSVCCQFPNKLIGMRNYSAAYIEGSTNLRTSSFKDHAASEMH